MPLAESYNHTPAWMTSGKTLGNLARGCSSVGRAQRCQRCCRGFESHHPLFLVCVAADRKAQMNMSASEQSGESQETDPAVVESSLGVESPETAIADQFGQEKQKLMLDVSIKTVNACTRHVSISVARQDVDRYFQEAFGELQPKAEVPGFRPGRAPRKIVEAKFRERIAEQVKSTLIMDSLSQLTSEAHFAPIGEPDLDLASVELPSGGPLTFEFNIEVRPDFDLPAWRGLKLSRPVYSYSDEEVDAELKRVLLSMGSQQSTNGPIEAADLVTIDLRFTSEGKAISEFELLRAPIRSTLSFLDGTIEDVKTLVVGHLVGDVLQTKAKLGDSIDDVNLRNTEVDVELEVKEVFRLQPPALTPGFLDRIGGFEDEDELRTAIRGELERRFEFQQSRSLRQQVVSTLLSGTDFELPESLLRRQARREVERTELQLRADGHSEEYLKSIRNEISQNAAANTASALREHFVLERLADEMKIDAEAGEYEAEIYRISAQLDEPVRRVRSRLEKRGQMDVLRNQIVERKVIKLILDEAEIHDQPMVPVQEDTTPVDHAIAGLNAISAPIPDAKYGEQPADQTVGGRP